MKTIEDIKVDRTYYHREVNAFGGVERIPYAVKVKREVEVVAPLTRLGYFFIDWFIFYLLSNAFYLLLNVVLSAQQSYDALYYVNQYIGRINTLLFFLYYAFTEFVLGGTFGKLIFGYVVIDEHAEKVSFSRILLRTIIRFVPFEPFSCIGEKGWHDRWSKTYVVKKKERYELRKQLKTAHDDNGILD